MRIIVILIICLLWVTGVFCTSQETFWCVQISSSNNLPELKTVYEKIKDINNARIEKIGSVFTIRAGFYNKKNQADELKALLEQQNIKNTIVRKCYYVKERIVYPESSGIKGTVSTISQQSEKTTKVIQKEVSTEVVYEKIPEAIPEEKTVSKISQQAETDTSLVKQEEKLEGIVKQIKQLFTPFSEEKETDITLVDTIFAIPLSEPSSVKASIFLKEQKKDAEQYNKGLKLTGQYIFNENTGLIEDEDTISYKWRGYLGLEWDTLRDGFSEQMSKRKQIDNELKIEKILADKKIKHEMYPFYRHEIICLFNRAKTNVLKKKIELLSEYEQVIKNLYFAHLVQKQDVQNIQKEIWRAQSMIEGYQEYEKNLSPEILERAKKIDAEILPYFGIKIKEIQQAIENPSLKKEILSLHKSIISEKYDTKNNVRLTPFLRYYFGKTDTGKKNTNDYFSLGFSFSIPLPVSEEKTANVQKAEEKYFEEIYDRDIKDTLHDVVNTYYEYIYKMDDLIKFLYQKQTILENIRKHLLKLDMKDDSFSVHDLVSASIQYLNTEFEILHIKQLMYLNLAFIAKYIPDKNISNLVFPVSIEKDIEMNAKQRIGERSVYIWSHAFNKFDNGFIYWFLKTKSVKYALVSFGKNTEKEKLKEFINLAGDSLKIEALIGDNELIKQKEKLMEIISELSNYKFSGLHLDIEPYTFPDWKTNSEHYLQIYLQMLQELKNNQNLKDKALTISIPVFYPEDFLKKIFPFVDRVYIMAYGTKNPETIARWIKKASETDKSKVILALRCKDFKNEMEMENFITEVKKLTGISYFAIHSLTEYIEIGGSYETESKTSIY